MFAFVKTFWPSEDPITKAVQRTEAVIPAQRTDPQLSRLASSKGRAALLAKLIEERNVYQALIRKGKGTWNTPDYINDETWACWLHTLSVLNRVLDAR